MRSYEVEWQGEHYGYPCVVVMTDMGHRCGYVGLSKGHPLYGKAYSQHCRILIPLRDKVLKGKIGKRGILPIFFWNGKSARPDVLFDVHGGITYSSGPRGNYPIQRKSTWWFGYDCGHAGDSSNVQTVDYCKAECESLAKQLFSIKNPKKVKR